VRGAVCAFASAISNLPYAVIRRALTRYSKCKLTQHGKSTLSIPNHNCSLGITTAAYLPIHDRLT
jgi:hypothetical protein